MDAGATSETTATCLTTGDTRTMFDGRVARLHCRPFPGRYIRWAADDYDRAMQRRWYASHRNISKQSICLSGLLCYYLLLITHTDDSRRRKASIRVCLCIGVCLCVFLHFLTLWPWPLTFWRTRNTFCGSLLKWWEIQRLMTTLKLTIGIRSTYG